MKKSELLKKVVPSILQGALWGAAKAASEANVVDTAEEFLCEAVNMAEKNMNRVFGLYRNCFVSCANIIRLAQGHTFEELQGGIIVPDALLRMNSLKQLIEDTQNNSMEASKAFAEKWLGAEDAEQEDADETLKRR